MLYDLVVTALPDDETLLEELWNGTVSISDPIYGSLNGIARPVIKRSTDNSYWAVASDFNLREISVEELGSEGFAIESSSSFSILGELYFVSDDEVAISLSSEADDKISPLYSALVFQGEEDVVTGDQKYPLNIADDLWVIDDDESSFLIKDVEQDLTYSEYDTSLSFAGAEEVFTDTTDERAFSLFGELWIDDDEIGVNIQEVYDSVTSSEYFTDFSFSLVDDIIVSPDDFSSFSLSDVAELVKSPDGFSGFNVLLPVANYAGDESSFNVLDGYTVFFESEYDIGYTYLSKEEDPVFAMKDKAFIFGSSNEIYQINDEVAFYFTGEEVLFFSSVDDSGYGFLEVNSKFFSVDGTAIIIGSPDEVFHGSHSLAYTHIVGQEEFLYSNSITINVSGDNDEWHYSNTTGLTLAKEYFFDDIYNSFTLDNIQSGNNQQYGPIRWHIIDHLNTHDWKFLSQINQIPLQTQEVQVQVFTQVTDSVFDPSAFSETIKDTEGRIQSITYFTDFNHDFPRYSIEFSYVGSSMVLANSLTRHYDMSGANTHIIEEWYTQNASGDTIAATYQITELVPSPIAIPYEGSDTPGQGQNTLLPGQTRIWKDTAGVANDGEGEINAIYHVSNQGGQYYYVEMSLADP